MFSKKPHIDAKKSSQKVLDTKKDSFHRIKHLRLLLGQSFIFNCFSENCIERHYYDVLEAQNFFELYYSHIYFIFFDTITNLEAPLKQRGQKQAREELDSTLYIFEVRFHTIIKILVLLPELISKRWQHHSITVLFKKLLHHQNSIKMRQEGMRLFLIWYQIIEDVNDHEAEQMFMSLVPGIVPSVPNLFQTKNDQSSKETSFYTDYTPSNNANNDSVSPCELEPLVPVTNEPEPQDITCYYLQCLMDYVVSQVTKVQWKEHKASRHRKSFEFLFSRLRIVYFDHIFPNLNKNFVFYSPKAELPSMSENLSENTAFDPKRFKNRDTLPSCKAVIIRWLAKYLRTEEVQAVPRRESFDEINHQTQFRLPFGVSSVHHTNEQSNANEWREPSPAEYDIVKNTLNANVSNVSLVHELFRQAFLLPFSHAMTMRKVVAVYKDWIYRNGIEVPLFFKDAENDVDSCMTAVACLLRAFVTNASYVFLLYVPPEQPSLLEEQVDMCKRVLNIYRYMVMKLDMDKNTWYVIDVRCSVSLEQLLNVMLGITSKVLSENIPVRKEDTLGGRLAPAFFQTLIVTWIKANLAVHISNDLWVQFQSTLSSLTKWEELIKEWSKTMDTVTRVMSRYVYNINLHDLPLERPSERRKIRGFKKLTESGGRILDKSISSDNSSPRTPLSRMRSHSGASPPTTSPKHSIASESDVRSGVTRSASDSHLLERKQFWTSLKEKGYSCDERRAQYANLVERSKSLENIYRRIESPSFSEASISHSRSPSPTPSGGIDCNSLKDSPLNLDSGVSVSNESSSVTKSVIAGGTHRGWSHDSAVILWRRMLGVLGDFNFLEDPELHRHVLECVGKIIDDFCKVRDNLGISIDNQSTPSPPNLVPPIYYFAPSLFRAVQLNDNFRVGKLIAYKYISLIFIRRHEISLTPDLLACFYRCLFEGLASNDLEITRAIVKYCGSRLFSLGLPGSSCLLFCLMDAATKVLSSSDSKEIPRSEAIVLFGTLIGMTAIYKDVESLNPNSMKPELTQCKDLKVNVQDRLLNKLLKASKKETTGFGRSTAFNSLGIFIYNELLNRSNHPRLVEVTDVLISATNFSNRVLSRIACDVLRLLCDHVTYLVDNRPEIPRRIIEGLLSSLIMHWQYAHKHDCMKEMKNLLISLMLCLGEWCLCVPKVFLITKQATESSSDSLLQSVLNGLTCIIKGEHSFANMGKKFNSDMDYTILVDNMNTMSVTPTVSPRRGLIMKTDNDDKKVVQLAAKLLVGHLLNFLGHFPLPLLGASRLTCLINEDDENPFFCKPDDQDELSVDLFSAPNVLFFIVNDCSIVSFVDYGSQSNCNTRMIVRDLIGKFAWDCSQFNVVGNKNVVRKRKANDSLRSGKRADGCTNDDKDINVSDRTDPLDTLLRYISHTSPECMSNRKQSPSNSSAPSNSNAAQTEENMIALLLNQQYQEMNYVEYLSTRTEDKLRGNTEADNQNNSIHSYEMQPAFKHCRQLIDQLGSLLWERRTKIDLLNKNEHVLRELRNLDNQTNRETHKIAVIYVAEGQEDKNSILLNESGSQAYEEFVAGLGWEVDLGGHMGFRGGLQQNKSTGITAPYYANSFIEVIFHVSTRIATPKEESDSLTKKLRHLGNDEVHIVWSEHTRDYRRNIIATEFGDVLIVIYPLSAFPGYYRIHVSRKPEVPCFGPLFSGAVVSHSALPGLVRATAINASRAKRMQLCQDRGYMNYFEERSRSIDTIVEKHKQQKCFEEFASTVYSPLPLGLLTPRPMSSLSAAMTGSTTETSSTCSSNQLLIADPSKVRNRP
ncbi:ral GTPase-activating protein subunit alpha-1-like protein, partial [Leptotrombidium deliense]